MLISPFWLLFRTVNGFCLFLMICHDSFHVIQKTLNFPSGTWRQCCLASDLETTVYLFLKDAAGSQEMFAYCCIKRNGNYCSCNYNCQSGNSVALSPPVPFRGLSLSVRCFWRCDVRTVHDSIHNESMTPLSLFSLRGSGINNELWSVKYHPRLSRLCSASKLSESFCLLFLLCFCFFLRRGKQSNTRKCQGQWNNRTTRAFS